VDPFDPNPTASPGILGWTLLIPTPQPFLAFWDCFSTSHVRVGGGIVGSGMVGAGGTTKGHAPTSRFHSHTTSSNPKKTLSSLLSNQSLIYIKEEREKTSSKFNQSFLITYFFHSFLTYLFERISFPYMLQKFRHTCPRISALHALFEITLHYTTCIVSYCSASYCSVWQRMVVQRMATYGSAVYGHSLELHYMYCSAT